MWASTRGYPAKGKLLRRNNHPPLGASGSVVEPAPQAQSHLGLSSWQSVRRRVSSTWLAVLLLGHPPHDPSTTTCARRRSQSCPPAPVPVHPTIINTRRSGKLPACGKTVCGDTKGSGRPLRCVQHGAVSRWTLPLQCMPLLRRAATYHRKQIGMEALHERRRC